MLVTGADQRMFNCRAKVNAFELKLIGKMLVLNR